MADEMKDVCYGCGKVDVYGSMRDVNDIEFEILCDGCWTEKEKELDQIDKQMKFMHKEKQYDPPMTDTEQYLLKQQREDEHKSHDY
jgi:hypothetical protein